MMLGRDLGMRDRHLILIAPSPAVTRVIGFTRLDGFLLTAASIDEAQKVSEARAREREDQVAVQAGARFRALVWYGEITAVNVDQVWERTRSYIEEASTVRDGSEEPNSIVIDLSVVRFIDSSGLGLMVRARKFAAQIGLKLRFTNVQSAVLNVVRIARLEGFLLDQEPRKLPLVSHLRKAAAGGEEKQTETALAGK
jgi:anti-anti-sigma factor